MKAFVLIAVLLLISSEEVRASHHTGSALALRMSSEHFTLFYSQADASAVSDLVPLLENYHAVFQADFGSGALPNAIVEVYPDQASYDASIMNPRLRGTPAISGHGRMQLVSPRAMISQNWIPYGERLRFGVHELAHLYMNLINPLMPEWMQEGTATLFGSPTLTAAILKEVVPRLPRLPNLDEVLNHYSTTAAADLFSASLVGFVIETYGKAAFRAMLRDGRLPIENAQANWAQLETSWWAHLRASTE